MELGGNLVNFREEEVGHSSTDFNGEDQNQINIDSDEASSSKISNEKESNNVSGDYSADDSDIIDSDSDDNKDEKRPQR